MKKLIFNLLLLSSIICVHSQVLPRGFSKFKKAKAPNKLIRDDECARIVIINSKSIVGKVVLASICIDGKYLISAKNGSVATYRVKPGLHEFALISGIDERNTRHYMKKYDLPKEQGGDKFYCYSSGFSSQKNYFIYLKKDISDLKTNRKFSFGQEEVNFFSFTKNLEAGTTCYFMVVERKFRCGPILSEVGEYIYHKAMKKYGLKISPKIYHGL